MCSAATLTADLTLGALRQADKPMTVAEIRQEVRRLHDIVLDRTTIASALKRLAIKSQAASDLRADNVTCWYAIPS